MKKKMLCLVSAVLLLAAAVVPNFAYAGQSGWTASEETVYYDRIEQETFMITPRPASYMGAVGCAPTAGATILSYYDRTFPNVIPDLQATMLSSGGWNDIMGSELVPLMQQLSVLMNTDADGGTTAMGFKRGLGSYLKGTGYSVGFRDVVSGGEFYYNSFMEYIEQGMLVALLLSKQNMVDFTDSGNSRHYTYSTNPASHVAVAYGYGVTYFFRTVNGAEENFRTDFYLLLATHGSYPTAILNSTLGVDSAFAIRITNQ